MDYLNSKEVEDNIISLLISYPKVYLPKVQDKINPEDFFEQRNRKLFEIIQELGQKDKPIDNVSIYEIVKFKKLEGLITEKDIDELTLSGEGNIEYLVKTLIKYSKKRQVISLCDGVISQLRNNIDVDDVLLDLNIQSDKLISRTNSTQAQSLSDSVVQVMDMFDRITSNDKNLLGVDTSFNELNMLLSGLCPSRFYVLGARPSMGKALSLDTDILTPNGWVKNKDIKLGDTVIGRDGKSTKVIGVYPQGITNNYTLTLKDGRKIDCCENHEWTVYSSRWDKERTFTTKELYNKLKCVRYKNRISLPKFTGDYGEEKKFVIPPYVMGILIGDGCLTKGMYYCKPNNIIFNKVKSLLPQSDVHFWSDNKMVCITNFPQGKKYIKDIGLNTQSYNKFIPQEYFHSSKKQREELFNGLMDTDGYKFNTGWEYSTTSKQLALDVQQLAWSLGYSAKIKMRMGKYKKGNQSKETRLNYRVFITMYNPLTIVDIQPTKQFETQCIHVDNKDSLFVIKDYIVTHNSSYAQQIAEAVALNHNVLFFSLEMGVEEYTQRSIFRRSGYNQEMMTRGNYTSNQIFEAFAKAGDELSNLNLQIIDDSSCTLSTIETNIKQCINKKGSCDLVIVDYIQLMKSDNKYKKEDYDIVTDNSKGLKRIARKYKLPVLALSQLGRQVEQRQDKRPILSDLRDSGSIEQDADVVMFLYRPDIYFPTNPLFRNRAELIIAKNRQGARGTVIPMVFNGTRVEFKEQTYKGN